MLRIRVEPEAMTPEGLIILGNSYDDLDELSVGMEIIIYEAGQYEVEGIVEHDWDEEGIEWWYVIPNWATCRDLFDESE